jgi:sigma-E factor negative regulatory protein RseA
MTDQIREQLSALLDGELPRDEIGLLMRRLGRDAELRRAFGAYALIGETLRAPGGRIASGGFAARVSASIEAPAGAQEAPPSVPMEASAARVALWKRPAVRTALAASAAAVAVVLFRPESGTQQVVQSDAGPVVQFAAASYSPTPAQSQRLASYMVAHSQYSTPMVRRNVLTGLLAADPGLTPGMTNVSYEIGEAR